jgi:acetylornithine deacetylase
VSAGDGGATPRTSAVPADVAERVLQRVEANRGALTDLLAQMVRIPSETHPPGGDEGPAQRFVAGYLRDQGLEVDVFEPDSVPGIEQHPGWWDGLDFTDRPNVVATRRGAGGGRSLILNGHIDVVPAGPRDRWTKEPYGAEIEDGRLYGRGAVDMKGGVAAMIMALQSVLEAGFEPLGDVVLQSVVNEEFGGYNGTLACCVKGYEADAAIVTEPTGLRVSPAIKGGQVYKAVLTGAPTHSCFWWRGVSALDHAILLKDALRSWEALRTPEVRNTPFFDDPDEYPVPAMSDTVWSLVAGDPAIMAHPETAEMQFWVDHMPGEDYDELLRRFEEHVRSALSEDPFLREHPPRLERAVMRPFQGNGIPADHPIIGALQEATAGAGEPVKAPLGMPSPCDGMIFNLYSETPAVVFGAGDLALAHAPDEYIELDELVASVKILALTILDFCGHRATG